MAKWHFAIIHGYVTSGNCVIDTIDPAASYATFNTL